MKLLSTHKFNDFDHNTRKWAQTIYNRNMISNLICQIDSSNETYLTNLMFPLDVTDYNNLIQSFPNFSQHQMYTTFRNIELTTKNISFVLVGSLQRDAGQIIYLKTENTNLKPELNGIWAIYGCIHTWDNGIYTNDITCYKTIQQTAIMK